MKLVKNKKLSIPELNFEKVYSDLLMSVIKLVPQQTQQSQGGLNYDEIKKRIRIEDIIIDKKEGDDLKFEDADYEFVKNLAKSHKWGVSHKSIIEFIDDILNAEQIKNN